MLTPIIELPHLVWWLQGGLISVAFALPIVAIVSERSVWRNCGGKFGFER
jgi:hypothetical protein